MGGYFPHSNSAAPLNNDVRTRYTGDTVFGIDNNLRKTFTTAVFTGIGVISFIVGSELMESVIGYGAAGGVFVEDPYLQ